VARSPPSLGSAASRVAARSVAPALRAPDLNPLPDTRRLKAKATELISFLRHYDYQTAELGINILAIHATDKTATGFGPQARSEAGR
jgi:hypothetical protein